MGKRIVCPICSRSIDLDKILKKQKEEKEVLKRDFTKATWIGEDGDMACISKTRKGALRKFRALMRKDGSFSTDEIYEIKEEGISIGWFKLTNSAEKKEYDDSEWLISYKTETPYQVWVYRF